MEKVIERRSLLNGVHHTSRRQPLNGLSEDANENVLYCHTDDLWPDGRPSSTGTGKLDCCSAPAKFHWKGPRCAPMLPFLPWPLASFMHGWFFSAQAVDLQILSIFCFCEGYLISVHTCFLFWIYLAVSNKSCFCRLSFLAFFLVVSKKSKCFSH